MLPVVALVEWYPPTMYSASANSGTMTCSNPFQLYKISVTWALVKAPHEQAAHHCSKAHYDDSIY